MTYRGRFAPSPTGPLHLGSLVAALGSFLDARANQGQWLVRMEDIDPPREVAEARLWIPRQLEDHGLYWDGHIIYQSGRLSIYQDYLQKLAHTGKLYSCNCSRKRIKELGGIYDGLCRSKVKLSVSEDGHGLRIQLNSKQYWKDLVQGEQSFTPEQLHGDFIVKRRDGLFSYQLAVAVDDSEQKITHVVRGADLIDSTARQTYLHRLLHLKSPEYGHLPVVENTRGQKLSKQNLAASLDETAAQKNLVLALTLLGQGPDTQLGEGSVEDIIQWAIAHWSLEQVPLQAPIKVPAEN